MSDDTDTTDSLTVTDATTHEAAVSIVDGECYIAVFQQDRPDGYRLHTTILGAGYSNIDDIAAEVREIAADPESDIYLSPSRTEIFSSAAEVTFDTP